MSVTLLAGCPQTATTMASDANFSSADGDFEVGPPSSLPVAHSRQVISCPALGLGLLPSSPPSSSPTSSAPTATSPSSISILAANLHSSSNVTKPLTATIASLAPNGAVSTSTVKKATSPSTTSAALEFLSFKWLFKKKNSSKRASSTSAMPRATTVGSLGTAPGTAARMKKLSTTSCLNALLTQSDAKANGSHARNIHMSPMKASYSFDDIDRLLLLTPVHGASRTKGPTAKATAAVASNFKSNLDLVNLRLNCRKKTASVYLQDELLTAEQDEAFLRTCALCYWPLPSADFHTIWSCGCSFCRPCLNTYLTIAIGENMNVPFISCPDAACPQALGAHASSGRRAASTLKRQVKSALGQNVISTQPLPTSDNSITQQEVELLVDERTFALYKKLRLEYEVERDPSRTWCPTPNCDNICIVSKPNLTSSLVTSPTSTGSSSSLNTASTATKPRSQGGSSGSSGSSSIPEKGCPCYCTKCDSTFCSNCRKEWHANYPCSLPVEDDLMMLLNGRSDGVLATEAGLEIKRCPRCAVWIERDEGCAQMMCRKCKHVFCWFCLQSLEDDFLLRHYDRGPCKNKLGHTRASVIWHRTQVIGIFAGFGVLLLLASPLFLLAAPCILCCNCCCSSPCKYLEDSDDEGDERLDEHVDAVLGHLSTSSSTESFNEITNGSSDRYYGKNKPVHL